MFALSSELKFHLYNQPTDMRKSFDALSGLIRDAMESNPCNGEVYMFINKPRNKAKLLHWQGGGFVLYYKRLEEGTFEIPRYDSEVESLTLSYTQMAMLIDGFSIKNLQKRKRYQASL